jgi:hypothetical protein
MNAVVAPVETPKLRIRIPPPKSDEEILKTPQSPVAPPVCPTYVMNWLVKKYERVKR